MKPLLALELEASGARYFLARQDHLSCCHDVGLLTRQPSDRASELKPVSYSLARP